MLFFRLIADLRDSDKNIIINAFCVFNFDPALSALFFHVLDFTLISFPLRHSIRQGSFVFSDFVFSIGSQINVAKESEQSQEELKHPGYLV
jgi:hypothetical protein